MQKGRHSICFFNLTMAQKGQNEGVLFPRFLSFIVFAISESPQGYASAAFSAHNQGKEIWMSLL